jgi:hypothetical protein
MHASHAASAEYAVQQMQVLLSGGSEAVDCRLAMAWVAGMIAGYEGTAVAWSVAVGTAVVEGTAKGGMICFMPCQRIVSSIGALSYRFSVMIVSP